MKPVFIKEVKTQGRRKRVGVLFIYLFCYYLFKLCIIHGGCEFYGFRAAEQELPYHERGLCTLGNSR